LLVLLGAAAVLGIGAFASAAPSNRHDWAVEQSVLPSVAIDGRVASVDGVRDFDWRADSVPVQAWEARSYDLDRIESVWFVLVPFGERWRGPAHAFLSFGFTDSQYVAISVEARRRVGQDYSILGGMLKRFGIVYVIGDERDLIGSRVAGGDDVYVYPVRATAAAARELFVSMLMSADSLREHPEFYGTIRNNCTTNILDHVNRIAPEPIPYGPRILLPGYSDALALERGLLETDLPLEQARERYRVNERALRFAGRDDFSIRIREVDASF
jgi:hypothetical protein